MRAFLASNLPKKLSKVGILDERGMKKSKKHNAIAPFQKTYKFTQLLVVFVAHAVFYNVLNAFLLNSCSGGPRRLWMSGSALAELWEALGELWEALYI